MKEIHILNDYFEITTNKTHSIKNEVKCFWCTDLYRTRQCYKLTCSLSTYSISAAKAIYIGENITREYEADSVGHIVSHSEFNEKSGLGYRPNINASLTLTGLAPGSRIDLDFLYFDIYQYEDVGLPCADYLLITGATRSTSGRTVPKLCGWKEANENIIKTIVVRSTKLTFTFRTRRQNIRNKGFLLRYTVIFPSTRGTPYTRVPSTNKNFISTRINATDFKNRIPSGKHVCMF